MHRSRSAWNGAVAERLTAVASRPGMHVALRPWFAHCIQEASMSTLASYQLEHSVATLHMDDGKVNVLSPTMLSQLNAALDRAQADKAVVLLTGRPGVFSAGFDLSVLK